MIWGKDFLVAVYLPYALQPTEKNRQGANQVSPSPPLPITLAFQEMISIHF